MAKSLNASCRFHLLVFVKDRVYNVILVITLTLSLLLMINIVIVIIIIITLSSSLSSLSSSLSFFIIVNNFTVVILIIIIVLVSIIIIITLFIIDVIIIINRYIIIIVIRSLSLFHFTSHFFMALQILATWRSVHLMRSVCPSLELLQSVSVPPDAHSHCMTQRVAQITRATSIFVLCKRQLVNQTWQLQLLTRGHVV